MSCSHTYLYSLQGCLSLVANMSCSIFALYLPEARWHQLFNLPCSPRCCCGIVSLFPITERQGRDVLLPKITPVWGYLCRAVCHWSQTCHVASVRFIFLRQDRINSSTCRALLGVAVALHVLILWHKFTKHSLAMLPLPCSSEITGNYSFSSRAGMSCATTNQTQVHCFACPNRLLPYLISFREAMRFNQCRALLNPMLLMCPTTSKAGRFLLRCCCNYCSCCSYFSFPINQWGQGRNVLLPYIPLQSTGLFVTGRKHVM